MNATLNCDKIVISLNICMAVCFVYIPITTAVTLLDLLAFRQLNGIAMQTIKSLFLSVKFNEY